METLLHFTPFADLLQCYILVLAFIILNEGTVATIKKVLFIKNAAILTATALILRVAGIFFKVFLADKLGSEGVGLYHLVFSVYVLAATFATSGICTAVTRLITDEFALNNPKASKIILKKAIFITLVIALLSMGVIFLFSEQIAVWFLGDIRAALSLKILCLSLPFMGISSCLRGYFIAQRKTVQPSSAQIAEQITRIGIVIFLVLKFTDHGLEYTCAAVIIGDAVAETLSCIILYIMYRYDFSHLKTKITASPSRITKRILRISVPITSGRYLNSLLRTIENILVPKALQKSNLSSSVSLSIFGNIKGMALPILLFPSSLLNSISTLLIPEMSEATAKKQTNTIKRVTDRLITITCFFGFIVGAVFLVLGNQLGALIYKNEQVGSLICALSPLVPIMYVDSVADGMLKGLDQQLICFRNCILDSSIRIILIMLFVSNFGIHGFIAIMYLSNLFTAFLNVHRLLKIAKLKFQIKKWFVKPLFCSTISSLGVYMLLKNFGSTNIYVYTFSQIALSVILYVILMGFFKNPKIKNIITTKFSR